MRPFGLGGKMLRAASNRRRLEAKRLDGAKAIAHDRGYQRGKSDGFAEEQRRHTRIMSAPRGGSILLGQEPGHSIAQVASGPIAVSEYQNMMRPAGCVLATFEARQKAVVVDGITIRWFDWVLR
jgi:hypothetical protein